MLAVGVFMSGVLLLRPALASLFAVAVFAGLCVFSAVWLTVFRFGPAEWVWRSLTYGRLQPLLKRSGEN